MKIPTPQEIRDKRESANLSQTVAAGLVHCTLRAWQQWVWRSQGASGLWELFLIKLAKPKAIPIRKREPFNVRAPSAKAAANG